MLVAPTEEQIYEAMRAFLIAVLPANTDVILGQVNRVAEPTTLDYVIMWRTRNVRIETNIHRNADVEYTASIADTTMTVSAVQIGDGDIVAGSQVFGSGVLNGTAIVAQVSGSAGGAGVYTIAPSQFVGSEQMAAGTLFITQPTQIVIQCDVHGPASGNNAQVISTLMRDQYAVDQFATSGFDVGPLYADDPKQIPFINGESQYEDRWVVEAELQANQIVGVPQQFASAVSVTLIEVDTTYPAT